MRMDLGFPLFPSEEEALDEDLEAIKSVATRKNGAKANMKPVGKVFMASSK